MARGPTDGAIAERAQKSLGLLTIQQLDALGVSRQTRRTLLAGGVLMPISRGVFRHAAWPPSWHQQVLAAVLAVGKEAVASYATAAVLWRFDGMAPGPIEVTVPAGRCPRPLARTVVHRSRDLGLADIETRRGIPLTTAARTLLDLAPRLQQHQVEAALDGAERDGLVWRPHLRWRLDQWSRRP
jgi:predicted transcriptional regulator of viral defense system